MSQVNHTHESKGRFGKDRGTPMHLRSQTMQQASSVTLVTRASCVQVAIYIDRLEQSVWAETGRQPMLEMIQRIISVMLLVGSF